MVKNKKLLRQLDDFYIYFKNISLKYLISQLGLNELRTGRLDTTVAEAVAELENINQEETYLDWDPSSYPVLKAMRQNIDMYRSGEIFYLFSVRLYFPPI